MGFHLTQIKNFLTILGIWDLELIFTCLHDCRKIETTPDKRYKKEKFTNQQDKLSLLRRKRGVANEEESDKEVKN